MKTTITLSVLTLFSVCTGFTPGNIPVEKKSPVVNKTAVVSGFEFFRTHRQGRAGVTATWGISNPGNEITGFMVEKTYEDPSDPYANWTVVAAMPCSGARSYKCTDTGVYPGYISYRVTALLAGGGEICTPVSTVHIVSH